MSRTRVKKIKQTVHYFIEITTNCVHTIFELIKIFYTLNVSKHFHCALIT